MINFQMAEVWGSLQAFSERSPKLAAQATFWVVSGRSTFHRCSNSAFSFSRPSGVIHNVFISLNQVTYDNWFFVSATKGIRFLTAQKTGNQVKFAIGSRNLNQAEWNLFFARILEFLQACKSLPVRPSYSFYHVHYSGSFKLKLNFFEKDRF